jgi:hypothetical protein
MGHGASIVRSNDLNGTDLAGIDNSESCDIIRSDTIDLTLPLGDAWPM